MQGRLRLRLFLKIQCQKLKRIIPLKSGFGYLLNQNLKKTIHSNYEALNHHICFFDFKNPLSKKDINFSFYDVFKNCWIK